MCSASRKASVPRSRCVIWEKDAALGSAGAVMMFLTTLSFLFSTPGWEPSLGGFPALSAFLPDTRIP